MRWSLLVLMFVFVLLGVADGTAACHDPPNGAIACHWADPPFGVVPVATCLAGGTVGYASGVAQWTLATADEVLWGCP